MKYKSFGVVKRWSFLFAFFLLSLTVIGSLSGCSGGLFGKTHIAAVEPAPSLAAPQTEQVAARPASADAQMMADSSEEVVLLPEFEVGLVSAKNKAPGKTTQRPVAAKVKKSAPAQTQAAVKQPKYNVKSVMAMDYTNRVILLEQDVDREIPPASLTKILSMYVILDAVKAGQVGLNDKVRISESAANTGGSHMGLTAGEVVTLHDLLLGMAVASGNDATAAAAQYVGGSEANFVKLMNQKAKTLGMSKSVFKNVHGLPAPGQMTTARDMMTLTRRYVAAHPDALAEYHARTVIPHRVGYTANSNPLLGHDGVDGLKTGYVRASGFNLITTVKRGNTRIIMVMLGAKNKQIRQDIAEELLETVCRPAPELAMRGALPPSAKKTQF